MSFDVLGDLNWLAVLVATIAYFALGGVWFATPVFGKPWMRSLGWAPAEDEKFSVAYYIGPLVTCFVASLAVAMLAAAAGADSFGDGLVLGVVTGVGLAGAVLVVTGYFDPKKPKPMVWTAITGGYHLVGLVIAAVIVSTWT